MRIKRVEIIGFKSFCDRAVVQIGESITGVVGPNGCGKSNIVDAIRWCMGEQSAKHLRGKAMEDVIFAGSETRGPAPMAEVSLTFDDVGFSHETLELARASDEAATEQALTSLVPDGEAALGDSEPAPDAAATPPDGLERTGTEALEQVAELLADQPPAIDFARYTEVTITRRLFRDGVSQYYINKTPCRLRDITDFFLGTGVGTKAYAIIEQGRIGQIVSARPQDRRAIIEEAAGITKFKAKKKAAERKLDQTRQNLMRVSDIVAELDKRMGTLRRQAQKAERYRKYKSEMRDIELCKGSQRWLELAGEAQLIGGRLASARGELTAARTEWTVKDAHILAERGDLAVEERRLVGIQDRLYELDNRIRLGDSKIGFERREADELAARSAAAQDEITEIASQRERGASELAERSRELAALEAEVTREAAAVAEREAAASEGRRQVNDAQTELDAARVELATRRTEIATTETQLAALASRRDEAERRLAWVRDESEQQHGRLRDLEREGRRVDGALAELRQTRLELGTQSDGWKARSETLTQEVARGEAEVETLRTELHRRRSRLVSLEEIQQRYEGFARGTRAVMQHASEWTTDRAAIHGVVADVVRAPEVLEVAVEAALGDRLGGVLVDSPQVGLEAVGYLKQGGGGRSAFVTVREPGRVAPAGEPGEMGFAGEGNPSLGDLSVPRGEIVFEDRSQLVAAHAAIGGDGVLGRMVDLVAFSDGYERLGRRLLGTTVVVDTLQRAIDLHEHGAADRLVTLDGDVVDGDGVVAGGSRDAQGAGVLAQKREIRDLHDIVGQLEHELSEAMQRLVTAKTELKQVTLALEGLRSQVHAGDLAIIGHEKDEARVRGELERLRDRLGQLATEQLELEDRLHKLAIDSDDCRARRMAAGERIEVLERAQLDLAAAVTSGRDRLESLAQALTEARVRAAQLGEQRSAAETATLRLEQVDHELAMRAERLASECAGDSTRVAALREACDQLASELDGLRGEHQELARTLDDGRAAYSARVTALGEVELAARDLRTTTDQLTAEVSQLELRDGQVAMTRRVLEEQIAERYQVELVSVLVDYHQRPLVGEPEDTRLGELRELIDRMGTDINLTAIDEFAEVSQRFEFLSAQRNDLERAVDQLQRAIDKINKTSRKLFRDTFASVNATFKEVFPRLFRGGQAALSLSGGDDVDLLEAGVEIMAQPPGKKNTTVDQLSGGEKALTAVALVFSIFLIKPSPFCILDEVDAPLDEANVDRYNELVREMTDRSQFIVITHNKRTMEAADHLYGVTMQEPGVSNLVSVNLNKLGSTVASPQPMRSHM